ncbi:DUF397 domain-containing protein [Lentzea sp. JNUCC 0626]|uniref:DUF397 domain-containing protein n=1 Tax=Lentzea sp. JNUCC 0626 TaxID=3367513 RepID=UPI003747C76C
MAAELTWKRSSYSNAGGSNCIECAVDGHRTWIRDSKDRRHCLIGVSQAGWRAFVTFARS